MRHDNGSTAAYGNYRRSLFTPLRNRKIIAMHRLVMAAPRGMIVDHEDHDGLNNQKYNLRLATVQQNIRHARKTSKPTSSRYKGVYRQGLPGRRKPWRAEIKPGGGARIRLGYFATEELAARAYDEQAMIHFGTFAVLNFPNNGK